MLIINRFSHCYQKEFALGLIFNYLQYFNHLVKSKNIDSQRVSYCSTLFREKMERFAGLAIYFPLARVQRRRKEVVLVVAMPPSPAA